MQRKRLSQASKTRHCKNWQASGLSQQEYCRQTDLNPKTFGQWVKFHKAKQLRLLPVEVSEKSGFGAPSGAPSGDNLQPPMGFHIKAALPSGIEVWFSGCANPEMVVSVLRGLGSCS